MRTASGALVFALAVLSCLGQARQTTQTPVILVTIDTLRADRLAAYGYTKGRTENITALAGEGVLFENAYVQTPITLPSHASILSGTYPMYHKVQDVVGRLREGVPTLGTLLKQSGYATGAFVGSSVLSSRWLLNRGFDIYDDSLEVNEGLRQVDFDRVERRGEEVLTRASKWLATVGKRPFFLWMHLYDPHDPYAPPAPFSTEFRERPYDGEIAYIDSVLGNLFQSLKALGLYDKSLIVFTADHGESLGEHKEVHHGFFIYDASLRVPLIFKLPDGRFKGQRLSHTVRSVDIAPTILQYVGKQLPATIQGESLLAMMAGKRAGRDLPVYAESYYPKIHFNWSPLMGYLSGPYKYIQAPEPELYQIKDDPGENSNILQSNQATASTLKAELLAFEKRYSAPASVGEDSAQKLDPETVARLKSLGYIAFAAASVRTPAGTELADPKNKIGIYNQLNRGITLGRRGFVERAIEILGQVAKIEPTMPVVHFLLGTEYFRKGWHLKAIEEFKETLKHNPESNVAMFNLARAYLESGQTDQAMTGFQYLIKTEPAHFAARHYLSLAYARRARYQEAVDEEIGALRLRPDYFEGYNNLGSFYLHLDQIDKAIGAYQKALSLRPGFVMARVNLALAYLKKEAYDDALQQAQEVVNKDPRRVLAHFYLGQAYLAKGMKPQAREAFQKAKELDPKLQIPNIPQ